MRHVAWWVLALLFVGFRLPYLSVPLERDEGEYAYIAQRFLQAGEVPYRDAFDQKPPLTFAAYGVALALFGESTEAIRAFSFLWSLGTLVVLAALGWMLGGFACALATALLYACTGASAGVLGFTANTETFMLLPMSAALFCALRALRRDGVGWWVAAGALAALACWFKQTAAVSALCLALAVLWATWRESAAGGARRLVRRGSLLVLGAAVASAPILVYFAVNAALAPMWDAVVGQNLAYIQVVPLSAGLVHLAGALQLQMADFWALWLLASLPIAMPELWRRAGGLYLWLLVLTVGVSIGLRFYPHYFVQLLPAQCLLGGLGIAGVWARGERRSRTLRLVLALGLGLLIAGPPFWARRDDLLWRTPEQISHEVYDVNPFPEAVRIAGWIREEGTPDDTVYIFGSEPQILFYAGRRSATRYIIAYPLMGQTGGFDVTLERQREVLREVNDAAPLHVVVANLRASLLPQPGAPMELLAGTSRLVEDAYELEALGLYEGFDQPFRFLHDGAAREHAGSLGPGFWRTSWIGLYRRKL